MRKFNSEKLGVTKEYKRQLYVDSAKMNRFKQSQFNGKKTLKDHYTGNTLHIDSGAAKNKHGLKAYTRHTADTDHIVPVETLHSQLKNNPYLSDNDVKAIANMKQNLRVTSGKYNRSKSAKSNIEVALNGKSDINLMGRTKVVADDIKARTVTGALTSALTVKNVNTLFAEGIKGSLEASAIPLAIMGVQNLVLVAKGEKKLEDAIKDVGKGTALSAATGGFINVASTGLSALSNSSAKWLQTIGRSNVAAQTVAVSILVKDSLVSYIHGEIDGRQFMEQIGEKGVSMVAGVQGAIIGQMLIPVPYVGAFVGSMVVSAVCVEVYKYAIKLKKAYKPLKNLEAKIEALAISALDEMEVQRNHLKDCIGQEYDRWEDEFNSAFDAMISAALNDDVNEVTNSFDQILSIFGENVAFKSFEEFEQFFMDENAVLKL
ncbi:hypothetical protein NYE69_30400 [Paenibacillus sp. FSL R5-0527]|uniref:hypothetical protein n=1 Tax=Paenibacillus sp. FSL R5-0527 TaxID=2975321 RepID=UPI00097B7536|nr:hypothetical protein BK140_20200 [Paenibacillus macerans]